MSAIDKLDASLLALTRCIAIFKPAQGQSNILDRLSTVSADFEAVRAELAAPILPESYDDPLKTGQVTLRDQFAMHAAPSILIHNVDAGFHANFAEAASLAYELADAMLAAREPPP